MNLQKAMRVRSELKKQAQSLSLLIDSVNYTISFESKEPSEDEIQAKRDEKNSRLDGMSYKQAVQKLFALTEACYDVNIAIEKSNQRGHNLLYKEAELKSKLAFVENILGHERSIDSKTSITKTDYENTDSKGNFKMVEVDVFNYPILGNDCFGMNIVALRKSLEKELEKVRDELSAFNANQTVDWEVPDGLL